MEKEKKRCQMPFSFRCIGSLAEMDVMVESLQAYKKTATRNKRYIVEDLLGLIKAQHDRQYPQGDNVNG